MVDGMSLSYLLAQSGMDRGVKNTISGAVAVIP